MCRIAAVMSNADVVAVHDHGRTDSEPGIARLDDGARKIDAWDQRVNACDSALLGRSESVLVVDTRPLHLDENVTATE
jgi:hypothetical protein